MNANRLPPVRFRNRPIEHWAIAQTRSGTRFPDFEISSFGRVRRVTNSRVLRAGDLVAVFKKTNGYLAVNLRSWSGARMVYIHELVCSSFNGLPDAGASVVRHLNGLKSDNRSINLRWGTPKENGEDAVAHGQIRRGRDHGRGQAKHSVKQAAEIKGLMNVGARNITIAEHYGLSPQAVCNIRKGRTGKDIEPIPLDEAERLHRFVQREVGRRRIRESGNS